MSTELAGVSRRTGRAADTQRAGRTVLPPCDGAEVTACSITGDGLQVTTGEASARRLCQLQAKPAL